MIKYALEGSTRFCEISVRPVTDCQMHDQGPRQRKIGQQWNEGSRTGLFDLLDEGQNALGVFSLRAMPSSVSSFHIGFLVIP
jgi:hypothetical protein